MNRFIEPEEPHSYVLVPTTGQVFTATLSLFPVIVTTLVLLVHAVLMAQPSSVTVRWEKQGSTVIKVSGCVYFVTLCGDWLLM